MTILTLTLSEDAQATVEGFASRAGMTASAWVAEQIEQAFGHRHVRDSHIPSRILRNARREAHKADD